MSEYERQLENLEMAISVAIAKHPECSEEMVKKVLRLMLESMESV